MAAAYAVVYAIISALSTIWRSKRTRPKVTLLLRCAGSNPHARPASRRCQHGDRLPAFFTLGGDLNTVIDSNIAHPSAAALVDLILVTLQYCPNNSRTEP